MYGFIGVLVHTHCVARWLFIFVVPLLRARRGGGRRGPRGRAGGAGAGVVGWRAGGELTRLSIRFATERDRHRAHVAFRGARCWILTLFPR